jgi:glucan phosphoethanolaminetransferase (alkaline phosphatase superfamily)
MTTKTNEIAEVLATTAGCILLFWLFALCGISCCTCCSFEKGFHPLVTITTIFGTVSRICFLVEVSILFYRVNSSWYSSQSNLDELTMYQPFTRYNSLCGDSLNNLNVAKASSFM